MMRFILVATAYPVLELDRLSALKPETPARTLA